jgi:uncharacterized C2H2 Zn-finger protein
MGASERGPTTECNVCGRIFKTVEDLEQHNREAHLHDDTATRSSGQAS